MKYVLDVNVLVSAALIKNSLPGLSLQKAISNGIILLSDETLNELKRTLNKSKLKKYITKKDKYILISRLISKASFIEITQKINECRDPKDNKYLELALSGNADCIITGDKDLLVLHPFRGIPIITPKDFLMIDK